MIADDKRSRTCSKVLRHLPALGSHWTAVTGVEAINKSEATYQRLVFIQLAGMHTCIAQQWTFHHGTFLTAWTVTTMTARTVVVMKRWTGLQLPPWEAEANSRMQSPFHWVEFNIR